MIRPTGRPDKTATTRCRRNDRGLTTLEWLLIVAAVAGLAALAVVLVQNVVDDTAEQISGSSARLTAAQVAAQAISDDDTKPDSDSEAACRRLTITYSDAFAGDTDNSRRTSLWTDKDIDVHTGDMSGGVCGIVSEAAAKKIRSGTADNCTGATKPIAAELGGKTLALATGSGPVAKADPDCYFVS